MVDIAAYGDRETAWCPGCGNFGIVKALKQALAGSGLEPRQVLIVSGIGQAAKLPHYINCNMFNGLHGRSLPLAAAAKLVSPGLTVIAASGDGCHYAEGGNHFIHAIRRNPDVTAIVHNNQVYGLTKGQASPTSEPEFANPAQPFGSDMEPFNAIAVAVAMRCAFVARGFSGMINHLDSLIRQALAFKGFALVEALQPCVSFNRLNTFAWYKERVYELPASYDPTDWETAMTTAREWGDKIPIGVIYKRERPLFEDHFPALKNGPLVDQPHDRESLKKIMESFA
jgi:2-oxoglutarate ferredoxin oxidoreductase subunit beta